MQFSLNKRGQLFAALFCLCSLPAMAQQLPASREEIQLSFSPVAKQAAPAVVNIYASRKVVQQNPLMKDPLLQQFFGKSFGMFGMPQERVEKSLGSGVLVSPDGKLVTNYHVIENAQEITAVLSDRREFKAEVVLRDEAGDLAVLQLQEAGDALPYLQPADSDALEVGDLVLAIGNPFGVGQTVTSGIISATARSAANVKEFGFFLQTDAAINPGNSGGALVDMRGQLVGVPTAIYTRSGGSNGIGFVIPSNRLRSLLHGESRDGVVLRPWLGARYQNIDSRLAESLGLERISGVLVAEVYPETPAAKAGLQSGDVILRAGDKVTDDAAALRYRIETAEPGTRLPLTLLRDQRERKVELMIALPPDEPARDEQILEGAHPLRGAKVANLNPALATQLNLNPSVRGVIVVEDRGQLAEGDRILRINKTAITSVKQLISVLEQATRGWDIELLRGNQKLGIRVVR
jgi:serine protease Do